MKKSPIAAILLIILPALSTFDTVAETPDYKNSQAAKAALSRHKFDPSARSDPFILSANKYIAERNDRLLKKNSSNINETNVDYVNDYFNDYVNDYDIRLSKRKEDAELLQSTYRQPLQRAVSSDNYKNVQDVFDDYYKNYISDSESRSIEEQSKKSALMKSSVLTQYDNNNESVSDYRTSVYHFINTYVDDIKTKRKKTTDNDHKARINRLNLLNANVLSTIARARQFSSGCKGAACSIPKTRFSSFTIDTVKKEPVVDKVVGIPKFKCLGKSRGVYAELCNSL